MHWLDRAARALVRPSRPGYQFFQHGWGDPEILARYRALVHGPATLHDLDVRWSPAARNGPLTVWEGEYHSPVEDLPDAVRPTSVRLMLPSRECRRLCLLMAAWNDGSLDARTRFARKMARSGIGAIFFDSPYFGDRHPDGTGGHPIRTVTDFAVLGRASVEEGLAVLTWLHRRGLSEFGWSEHQTLGVAGYSMGGNMGSFISAIAPFPVATAPLAASHSPGPVILQGVLRDAIDWPALSGVPDPEAELSEFLGSITVLNFPAPDHARHAVLVGARGDGFIPPAATEALHAHWQGSELRWTDEGHASLSLLRRPTLIRAISDSFGRVEAEHS